MRRRIMALLGLGLIVGVAVSQSDEVWKMRVHRGGGTDEYLVTEVDSVTFSAIVDTFAAPPMDTVPAGVFVMGDGEAACGNQEHEVTLTRDFYLGQYEVTNHEYLEALQWAFEHGYVTVDTNSVKDNLDGAHEVLLYLGMHPSYLEDAEIQFDGVGSFHLQEALSAHDVYPDGYDPADHPVKNLTWYGAARYCDWLSLQAGLPRAYEHSGDWSCNEGDPYGAEGYRLPTDAEWEYATQYEGERAWPWGNQGPDCSRANYGYQYCVGWTSPVGSYPDAPEYLGISDMAGNAEEFCNDWYVCSLGTTAVADPTGPSSGHSRVVHGGGWRASGGLLLRCASRWPESPDTGTNHYAIRLTRTADPQTIKHPVIDDSRFILESNTPNPFTARTQIRYSLPSTSPAVVNVYDATGRMIRTLRDESHGAGVHSVTWDGKNVGGEDVPAGIYLYELRWDGNRTTKRMLLVR
ncbi:SUMF1/EgtB/PvdO family nonheme iron enzyme [Candidatus Eisenbacteria bacterium]|uniref:SUMF1/EgtB/PvdO family nonheme iron enzyme n=1 Tax=Eiseniibacteriota bacterium TaxID=2212470 RepID=A0ABV6YKL3_UNCEI